MKTYELIVFDWDGTLMDSETKIVRCFRAASRDAGLPDPGAGAVRRIIGLGMQEAVAALFPDRPAAVRDRVIQHYREHFLYRDRTEMRFFPGVEQGLKALREEGYLLAVATSKARRGLDRLLQEWRMRDFFDTTRCADEARSKPHPRMLEDIYAQTGVAPDRALVVGDTTYDMEMARNAGSDRLAVSYGVHGCRPLKPYRPVACLDSFTEVCGWLL